MKLNALSFVLCLTAALYNSHVFAEIPPNAVWIDVRSPVEFERGHLPQATLIPHQEIEKGVAALNLPKDTPIYLYCAVGGRAEVAKQRLQAQDYSNVTNVGSLEKARALANDKAP